MRVYLAKNPKKDIERQPYFFLKLVNEEGDEDWVTIASFWKTKSGNGYSGVLNDNVSITVKKDVPPWRKPEPATPTAPTKVEVKVGEEVGDEDPDKGLPPVMED